MSEFDVNRSQQTDKSTTYRWVFSHLSHHKLLITGIFVGSFGNAALAAMVPVFVGIAFDAALESPANMFTIGRMALAVVISQTVRAVLQLGRNFSSAVIGERLERDMREELYISLLGKSTTFHDSQPVRSEEHTSELQSH